MKTILTAVSAIGLLAAAPAYAADSQVDLTANVDAACGVGNHVNGATVDANWNQDDIVVDLADTNGQFTGNNTFNNRSFGNLWCNGPAEVTITVSALAVDGNPAAAAPGDADSFANRFDLLVTGGFGGNAFANDPANLSINTTGESSGEASETRYTTGAFETGVRQYSGFNVEVLRPNNKRPVAGVYSGYVRVTATPHS